MKPRKQDYNQFWLYLENDINNSNADLVIDKLITNLSKQPYHFQIIFEVILRETLMELYNEKTIALLKLLRFEVFWDQFVEFSTWIILQGHNFYQDFITNPDQISTILKDKTDIVLLDGSDLLNVSSEAYLRSINVTFDEVDKYILPINVANLALPTYPPQIDLKVLSEKETKRLFPLTWKIR